MSDGKSLETQVEMAVLQIEPAIRAASSDPYVQEGLAKIAVRDLCWALVREVPENDPNAVITKGSLADHLRMMADLVESPDQDDD